mgnify:FL=1
MNTKSQATSYRLDSLKWLFMAALAVAAVVGNSHFSSEPLLYRVLALLVVGGICVLIALQTEKGANLWRLLRESLVEVRKVVWPSRQETNQTTLIVIAVVIVMGFILWLLDTFFGWIAAMIIG